MNRAQVDREEIEIAQSGSARVLENADIRVEVAPARGGKFLSFKSKRTGMEWLLPPLRPYAEALSSGGFELWDGGGFDECLPTVAPTATAPDHGEIWRHAWREEASDGSLRLTTTALDGAIAISRTARLDGPSLVLEYEVESRGAASPRFLYCAHPLLRVEPGDRVLLPAAVRELTIEASAGDRLGSRGERVAWPAKELNVVGPPDGLQADKVFAGPLAAGWCALVRPSLDEGIALTFDSRALPYLGIWVCRAAWPATGAARQYTMAFEPASAPCDSLADAERTGTAWSLKPGERRAWWMRFRLGTAQEIEAQQHASSGRNAGRNNGRA